MTSALGEMCLSLDAIGSDISSAAQELAAKASQLQSAAARAAAAARAQDEGARGAAMAAQALASAARACNNAALLLADAHQTAQTYVRNTWAGSGGGRSTGSSPLGLDGAGPSIAPSLDDVRSWLPTINPGYSGDPYDPRSSNCGSCALAVSQRLQGIDAVASLRTLSIAEMEAATGKTQTPMTPSDIASALVAQGPGSHAVVGIDREAGPGHWFNAYFDGTNVVAIDGQSGKILDWPPEYGAPGFKVTNWDAGI